MQTDSRALTIGYRNSAGRNIQMTGRCGILLSGEALRSVLNTLSLSEFRRVAFNLWVSAPLGSEWPVHRGCISDIYVMIYNISKVSVMKYQ